MDVAIAVRCMMRMVQLSYPSAGLLTPGSQLNQDHFSPRGRVEEKGEVMRLSRAALPRRKPNEAAQSSWYFKAFSPGLWVLMFPS